MNPFCRKTLPCLIIALCLTPLRMLAQVQEYEITATVEDSHPDIPALSLSAIEGYITEETSFQVRVGEGDALVGWDGRRIRGQLSLSDGRWRLDRIWPADASLQQQMDEINRRLRADTAPRQQRQFRKEGDSMPEFALIDQQGHLLNSADLSGSWVVINFAFTRCKVMEMCPAQTARMVDLQQLASLTPLRDLKQFTITFDPDYDTPGILTQYGRAKGADFSTYSFLTGPKPVILDLLKQFGVVAFESKNIIDHTVTTLLFNPEGRIVLRKDGNRWEPQAYLDRIRDLGG